MGDRANVAIKQNVKDSDGNDVYIYLYTHWDGYTLPVIVRDALAAGSGRWGDTSYLTRILFSHMIKDSILDETGYGISTWIGDNGRPIIYINDKDQTVTILDTIWSYKDYITLSNEAINAVYSPSDEDDEE